MAWDVLNKLEHPYLVGATFKESAAGQVARTFFDGYDPDYGPLSGSLKTRHGDYGQLELALYSELAKDQAVRLEPKSIRLKTPQDAVVLFVTTWSSDYLLGYNLGDEIVLSNTMMTKIKTHSVFEYKQLYNYIMKRLIEDGYEQVDSSDLFMKFKKVT